MSEIISLNEWNHISEIGSIPESINAIHCDTRDFHIILSKEPITLGKEKKVNNLLKRDDIKEEFLIKREQIIPFLKEIEAMSGGRYKWRYLNFTSVKTDGWLKYIRFYKWKEGQYIVCNSQSTAIHWRELQEKYLQKEFLHCQ